MLDARFPEWDQSPYYTLTLESERRLSELLTHLYVLIPVLDDRKHYWVDQREIEKLLHRGEGWLAEHPSRDLIVQRYLKRQRGLAHEAIRRLLGEESEDPDEAVRTYDMEESAIEQSVRLHEQRLGAVLSELRRSGARRVLDLGCGEGLLLGMLLQDRSFEEIVGMDVSHAALERARERLHLDRLAPDVAGRLKLIHGSLIYRDTRLTGYDAAAVVEVIEHLDPYRLIAFERSLFGCARPHTVVLTTPNAEYNVKWESLPAGHFRHHDHRFEWSRYEFADWSTTVAERNGYSVRLLAIGPEDSVVGSPTQMAVFSLTGRSEQLARTDTEAPSE